MKFAIRDDDTSYFTKPEDLERAYSFMKKGCVSLSVVPFSVPIHRDDVFPYGKGHEYVQYSIEKNSEIVSYINDGVANKRFDILMHGYSHEYRLIGGKWVAEMLWKNEDELYKEISYGKTVLEELFHRNITVFVAPNNHINEKGIRVIEKCGMDYSGIIQHFDRKINLLYLTNYLKRWGIRTIEGIPYPGVLDYGKHCELNAIDMGSFQRVKKIYTYCKKNDLPFVFYTHYWNLLQNKEQQGLLKDIYQYAIDDGAECVPLSELFHRTVNIKE